MARHAAPPTSGTAGNHSVRTLDGTGPFSGQVADGVRQGKAGQEDQTRHRTRGRDVRNGHQDERDGDPRQADRRHRSAHPRQQRRETPRQSSVGRHGRGEVGGRQHVGLKSRQHRQHAHHHHDPVARLSKEVADGHCDQNLGIARRDLGDRLSRTSHGHNQEQQRQIDHERDPQRHEHRLGNISLWVLDLPTHRRNQVESLQRDEGVAHGLRNSRTPSHKERPETVSHFARRRPLGDQSPDPREDQQSKEDDLADRSPLPAARGRLRQAPHIEPDRAQGVDQKRDPTPHPCRRRASSQTDDLFKQGGEEDREAERIEHRRHHRGEPHDPSHTERSFNRQDLPRVRVGSSRLGKTHRQLGKRHRRQERDDPVQPKGHDRPRPRGRKSHPRQGQNPSPDNRAHPNAGGAPETERA